MILEYQQNNHPIPIKKRFSTKPITKDRIKEFNGGKIYIIPAGREDNNYQEKLQLFNWQKFYSEEGGREFFFRLRDRIVYEFENPDYVFIDSRTGLTDIGGICTLLIPDIVVIFTGLNKQNLNGSKRIIQSINKHSDIRKDKKYLRSIETITVASHIPLDAEYALTREKMEKESKAYNIEIKLSFHYVAILSLKEILLVNSHMLAEEKKIKGMVSKYHDLYDLINEKSCMKAIKEYLEFLFNQHELYVFQGMGAESIPFEVALIDVYIPLKAKLELPNIKKNNRNLKYYENSVYAAQHFAKPQLIDDLIETNNCLIILGNPGTGKTFFLKYLSLELAKKIINNIEMNNRLPILVPIFAFADKKAKNHTISLIDFIIEYYIDQFKQVGNVNFDFNSMIQLPMKKGSLIFFLDGLDEIQLPEDRKKVFVNLIEFINDNNRLGNKIVITSRFVIYNEITKYFGEIKNLSKCSITNFDEEQIEEFVHKWSNMIAKTEGSSENFNVRRFLKNINSNEKLKEVSSNPLLLTIMASMNYQGINFPGNRVELYKKFIEVFLNDWNYVRSLYKPIDPDPDISKAANVIAKLSLWMKETNSDTMLFKKEDILSKLTEIFNINKLTGPAWDPQKIFNFFHFHTAILLEHQPGMYSFIYNIFQEYFAAKEIAELDNENIVSKLIKHCDDKTWSELICLCLTYIGITQKRVEDSNEIIINLIEKSNYKLINYMGKVLLDFFSNNIELQCKDKIIESLVLTIKGENNFPHYFRVESGDVLSQIGDIRKNVTTLDNMEFCLVPEGDFWMGERDENTKISYHYFIGKYPVTNAQYNFFVNDNGYNEEKYWKYAKKNGNWNNGKYRNRTKQGAGIGPFNFENHPVVAISWFESFAFTNWLNEKWKNENIIPKNWEIGLPTEAEWEKSARGGLEIPLKPIVDKVKNIFKNDNINNMTKNDLTENKLNKLNKRTYAWGNDWDINYLNSKETNINVTNTVGCFNMGSSPYGCQEMNGNVWEWSQSIFKEYPYEPDDGRKNYEDIENNDWISVRGGSYKLNEKYQRCSARDKIFPTNASYDGGFRIVIRPIS